MLRLGLAAGSRPDLHCNRLVEGERTTEWNRE
jgi:hypothetical protein